VDAALVFGRLNVSADGEPLALRSSASPYPTRGASPSPAPRRNRVVALLWHHGESSQATRDYFDRLAAIVAALRARIAATTAELDAAAVAAGAPVPTGLPGEVTPVVMGQMDASTSGYPA
jgi:hypothetical protein